MKKTAYRVGEGANLAAFPHGTKVGDIVKLTEAQAMYERDMGRITPASDDDGGSPQASDEPKLPTLADEIDRIEPETDAPRKPRRAR
ncbi:hypothetical protein [Methylobacterium nigriterrae]|uniref:hypothetical protein n=1 Tax=Methylobacterium nigriterrae TaxID=3127512 RepID=UPI0030139482